MVRWDFLSPVQDMEAGGCPPNLSAATFVGQHNEVVRVRSADATTSELLS